MLPACQRLWTPEAAFERAYERVRSMRGVEFEKPELRVVSREEWIRSLPVAKPVPGYQHLWEALGIVPKNETSVGGFRSVEQRFRGSYDVGQHAVTYITDTPKRHRDSQLVHALLHAAQRDVGPLYDAPYADGYGTDVRWAHAAAREGEAILYELEAGGTLEFDKTGPSYAVRWAYFGYVAGPAYVRARRKGSLAETCDALWQAPPMSTEQVLHPERRDPPIAVIAPDLSVDLGSDMTLGVTTVLGEWTIADWLGNRRIGGGLPDDLRWGGDVVQVYRRLHSAGFIVIVWTVWDDEASARRFETRVGGTTLRVRRVVGVTYGGTTELLRGGLDRLPHGPFLFDRRTRDRARSGYRDRGRRLGHKMANMYVLVARVCCWALFPCLVVACGKQEDTGAKTAHERMLELLQVVRMETARHQQVARRQ